MESFRARMRAMRDERKAVLFVGMGVSGVATAAFLQREGIRVVAIESQTEEAFTKGSKCAPDVSALRASGVTVHFGIDGERVRPFLSEVGLAVLSPGVSLEGALVGVLRREKIPLVSELELGIELAGAPCVVVTGTNGKSTTVSLIHHLLRSAGLPAILCGNVGTPVLALLPLGVVDGAAFPAGTILVVEASSYQLSSCTVLKPKVGVFLNLSENHLERHGTLDRYLAAKAQLFAQQAADDVAVLHLDDPFVMRCRSGMRSRIVGFTQKALPSTGDGAVVQYQFPEHDRVTVRWAGADEVYDCRGCALIGAHNRLNIAAALLAARACGVSPADLQRDLLSFKPLEHRLELLPGVDRGIWINDSKSTTVAASIVAIRAVVEAHPDRKLVLLMGGLAKAGSWEPLSRALPPLASRLAAIVLFGRDARLIAGAIGTLPIPLHMAAGVADAVRIARSIVAPDQVVLFSPGCASFDEFRDFEERGTVFKSLVYDARGAISRPQLSA